MPADVCHETTDNAGETLGGAVVASVLAVTAAACSSGSGAAAPAAEKSYAVGVTSYFLSHFTPGKSIGSNLDYALFTPLTSVDTATGKAVNAMAESIESADNTTWTIKLKPGWTFHNGEEVTAQSFADSWNATAYGPNAFTNNYMFAAFKGYADLNPADGKPSKKTLSGIEVADRSTLKVTLTKPLSLLPYVLAQTTFAPMPKAAFSDLDGFDRKPIGNGPYRLEGDGLAAGATKVVLRKFEGYKGQPGNAARIEAKSYQDEAAAYRDLQAGNVDVTLVTGNNLTNAATQFKDRLVRVPFPAVVYLGFPLWDKRFSDLRVRQAFSQAVDRDTIVKSLLRGFGQPAKGLAGPNIPGGGDADCAACSFDPARAKALLAEAGGWKGPLTLWTYQDPLNTVLLEAVGNQLRANLGIETVTTQAQPVDQLYPNLTAKKIDGPVLLYMGAGYPHLYALADQLFTKGSGTNVTGYDDPKFAALRDRAASAGQDEAFGLTREATRTALDGLPLSPLFQPVGGLAHSTRVSGVRPEFLGGAVLAAVKVG
ncbi:peptide ABC transporter substrate-binding protein [Nonomuraea africana]|uniref:Peptide/nickel transport system substrate-binding protein/oligopeptide transport system substrate-binding protein n=1 Tax=Nonomuraea africana TaxID=46171 RepID=A0ABR9KAF3_9ACTN|nr:ABC transporter substrate-binding protein [Nonomuraea africana]MBE1558991.1 peptide/nickel transport system substrate-binding protein/oligopeptide transport system substrate-binding protein [Nonomuraea africana]